jgi:hypothetical protein
MLFQHRCIILLSITFLLLCSCSKRDKKSGESNKKESTLVRPLTGWSHNAGVMDQYTSCTWTCKIENMSSDVLDIKLGPKSCQCLAVSIDKPTLAPHEIASVDLRLSTSSGGYLEYLQSLEIKSERSGVEEKELISVSRTTVNCVSFLPQLIDFGYEKAGGKREKQGKIRILLPTDKSSDVIEITDGGFPDYISCMVDKASLNSQLNLKASYKEVDIPFCVKLTVPKINEGAINSAIAFKVGIGDKLQEIKLPVVVFVEGSLHVEPSVASFVFQNEMPRTQNIRLWPTDLQSKISNIKFSDQETSNSMTVGPTFVTIEKNELKDTTDWNVKVELKDESVKRYKSIIKLCVLFSNGETIIKDVPIIVYNPTEQ